MKKFLYCLGGIVVILAIIVWHNVLVERYRDSHRNNVTIQSMPLPQNFTPSEQDVLTAKALLREKFPDAVKNLRVYECSDFVLLSDSSVFSFNKQTRKIKSIEFKYNISQRVHRKITDSEALRNAENFIKTRFPEINLSKYKAEVIYTGLLEVEFKGFDFKTGVELANYISVGINQESGRVLSITIYDYPAPSTTKIKINKDTAYKIALKRVDIDGPQLNRSYGPKAIVLDNKRQAIVYGFVFDSADRYSSQAVVVDAITSKVAGTDHIFVPKPKQKLIGFIKYWLIPKF